MIEAQKDIVALIERHSIDGGETRVVVDVPRRSHRKTDLGRRIVQDPTGVLPNALRGVSNVLRVAICGSAAMIPESTRDRSITISNLTLRPNGELHNDSFEFTQVSNAQAIVFDDCSDRQSRRKIEAIARRWPEKPLLLFMTKMEEEEGEDAVDIGSFLHIEFKFRCGACIKALKAECPHRCGVLE